MKPSAQPQLYVIAGPHGAGKTTFAGRFLPLYAGCLEFVNADLIAQGLSPFDPGRADVAAGKLMLERMRLLTQRRADFAFETTLSGKGHARLLEKIKSQGYRINLFFLWLPDVRLSIQRIADSVQRGGHEVPADIAKRRFARGISNFFHVCQPLCDLWVLLDNSTEDPDVIAYGIESFLSVLDADLFSRIKGKAETNDPRKNRC